MYTIFTYAPVAGRISATIDRSCFVSLMTCEASPGGRVGAPAGLLQPRAVVPPLPAVPLQSRPVRRGVTGPFLGRISWLPFKLALGGKNRATPTVCLYAL